MHESFRRELRRKSKRLAFILLISAEMAHLPAFIKNYTRRLNTSANQTFLIFIQNCCFKLTQRIFSVLHGNRDGVANWLKIIFELTSDLVQSIFSPSFAWIFIHPRTLRCRMLLHSCLPPSIA